jgi:hypothetical protein
MASLKRCRCVFCASLHFTLDISGALDKITYLNHFTQPDTIVPDPQNPQAWNRYAYALNNPIRYNDPTGHWELETNKPFEEERRNAYVHVAARAGKRYHGHLGEYYSVAAALYQNLATDGPSESLEVETLMLERKRDNVRINGWNSPNDAQSAAFDASGFEAMGVAQFGINLAGVVCPGCGATNPVLLRSTGKVADDQIEPENVGSDGLSARCQICGNGLRSKNKYWTLTPAEAQEFAMKNGLDPDQAAVYTPEFGGTGHWSLFRDAYGANGQFLPGIGESIEAFLRTMDRIKIP